MASFAEIREAHPDLDPASPVAALSTHVGVALRPEMDIRSILTLFDEAAADELAVLDDRDHVMGVVGERHARRRYFEALEESERELFGEKA